MILLFSYFLYGYHKSPHDFPEGDTLFLSFAHSRKSPFWVNHCGNATGFSLTFWLFSLFFKKPKISHEFSLLKLSTSYFAYARMFAGCCPLNTFFQLWFPGSSQCFVFIHVWSFAHLYSSPKSHCYFTAFLRGAFQWDSHYQDSYRHTLRQSANTLYFHNKIPCFLKTSRVYMCITQLLYFQRKLCRNYVEVWADNSCLSELFWHGKQ